MPRCCLFMVFVWLSPDGGGCAVASGDRQPKNRHHSCSLYSTHLTYIHTPMFKNIKLSIDSEANITLSFVLIKFFVEHSVVLSKDFFPL